MSKLAVLSGMLVIGLAASACGHRYIASRVTNPLIEDRIRAGAKSEQKMSVLTTRADRRTILVLGPKRICAEPPPDVGEAVSAQAIAELAARGFSAGYGTSSATAVLPLSQRSQGLETFRSASFVYCNMWLNGVLDEPQYREVMNDAFWASVMLTHHQIEKDNLPAIPVGIGAPISAAANPDTPQPPAKPPTPAPAGAASSSGQAPGATPPTK